MHRSNPTFKERIAINDKLREVMNAEGNRYTHPWDDAAVAKFLGGNVTVKSVANTRRIMFGNLLGASNPKALASRVTEIEEYQTCTNPSWKQP